jgi:hypothetical protein
MGAEFFQVDRQTERAREKETDRYTDNHGAVCNRFSKFAPSPTNHCSYISSRPYASIAHT